MAAVEAMVAAVVATVVVAAGTVVEEVDTAEAVVVSEVRKHSVAAR